MAGTYERRKTHLPFNPYDRSHRTQPRGAMPAASACWPTREHSGWALSFDHSSYCPHCLRLAPREGLADRRRAKEPGKTRAGSNGDGAAPRWRYLPRVHQFLGLVLVGGPEFAPQTSHDSFPDRQRRTPPPLQTAFTPPLSAVRVFSSPRYTIDR